MKNTYVSEYNIIPQFEGEWNKNRSYLNLVMVQYNGAAFISKKLVPKGVDISNSNYWQFFNINATIEYLKNKIDNLKNIIEKYIDEINNSKLDNKGKEYNTLCSRLFNLDILIAKVEKDIINKEKNILDNAQNIENLNDLFNKLYSLYSITRNVNTPITMKDLGSDVKSALTGGSTPVVGVNSVGNENLKAGSIEYMKHYPLNGYPLLLKENPVNLCNKKWCIKGYYADRNNGELVQNENFYATHFIYVSPNTHYSKSNTQQVAFYDINKNYISGISSTETNNFFITPENCYYIRTSISLGEINSFMINKGDSVLDFQEFILNKKLNIDDYFDIDISKIKTCSFSGNISINSIEKKINISSGIIFINNYWINTEPTELTFSTNNAYFLCFNSNINNFEVIEERSLMKDKSNYMLLFIYYNKKVYQCTCKEVIKIDTVSNGGWGITLEDVKENYTLNKVYCEWINGKKSPVLFLDDSTTDGDTTNGHIPNKIGVDNLSPNCYCKMLQDLLRTETNNSILRIYNGGFSGKTLDWLKNNIESIMQPFNDCKIAIIGFGINDRKTNYEEYYNTFYNNLEFIIKYCFDKGITPILMTTQATTEIYLNTDIANSRTKESINSCVNTAKKDLSIKYNIELIDRNFFTNKILNFTRYNTNLITKDGLHFHDLGHKLESYYFMKYFTPRVIKVDKDNFYINLLNQKSRSKVPNYGLTNIDYPYKAAYIFNRSNNDEIVLQDIWIEIENYSTVNIEGICTIEIDGAISSCNNDSYDLDVGVHHIKATSTEKSVNYKGVHIERI